MGVFRFLSSKCSQTYPSCGSPRVRRLVDPLISHEKSLLEWQRRVATMATRAARHCCLFLIGPPPLRPGEANFEDDQMVVYVSKAILFEARARRARLPPPHGYRLKDRVPGALPSPVFQPCGPYGRPYNWLAPHPHTKARWDFSPVFFVP